MSEPARQEHLVQASYHQVFLAPLGAAPIFDGRDAGTLASLVQVGGDVALILTTGCADGPVLVTVETAAEQKPAEAGWEVQEAVSLVIGKPLYVSSPTWAKVFDPVISPAVPGPYRVRVSARGRTANYDTSTGSLDERYLVQAWPETRLRPREVSLDDRPSR